MDPQGQSLEDELEVKLFERSANEVAVTPYKPLGALNNFVGVNVVEKKNVLMDWFGATSNDPSDSPPGPGKGYKVSHYLAMRSADNGSTYQVLSSQPDSGSPSSHYFFKDTTTAFGGHYTYTVFPVDAAGNSGESYQLANVSIPPPINNILVFKNAFNPDRGETVPIQYSLVESGHAWVRVYTVQGEFVATIFDETIPDRYNAQTPYLSDKKPWDGKSDAGKTVASGVYIIHLDAPGFHTNARVAVIK